MEQGAINGTEGKVKNYNASKLWQKLKESQNISSRVKEKKKVITLKRVRKKSKTTEN